MQTIKIEDNSYKKVVTKRIFKLTHSEIKQVVENSQRIEGYEPVSKEYELKIKAFMKEHKIGVSV